MFFSQNVSAAQRRDTDAPRVDDRVCLDMFAPVFFWETKTL